MQNDELISKAALKKEIQDVVLTVADTPLSNDYTSKLMTHTILGKKTLLDGRRRQLIT